MNARARRTPILILTLLLAMSAGEATALPPSHEAMSPTLGPDPGRGPVAKENVWSRGVSEENKRAAEVLFKEGNALLKDSICVSAAAKYRAALARWDHPNIHYNLAMALMNLDQPIELHGHLTKAIQYGPFPLEKDRFEHAKNYLALLERQVARVKVRCAVKGATVEMDGRPLFVPPGEFEGLVTAGQHTIVARGKGLVTNHSVRTLEGGRVTTIALDLKTMDELTGYRRRWPGWLPWAIVGTGAAVAAVGGGLQYTAIKKADVADRDSKAQCQPTDKGCEPGNPAMASMTSARSRAETMQKFAVLAYAVGGVTLTAGGVLAYLNRAEPYVKTYGMDEPREAPKKTAVEIVPLLDPDRLGLMAAVRF